DRMVGRSGGEGQHLEAVPAEDPLGRREIDFAPVAIDRRTIAAAVDLDAGQSAPNGCGKGRPPLRHTDAAARIGNAGQRMRENDAWVGEETAPVAGMVRALAQIDGELDRVAAARA